MYANREDVRQHASKVRFSDKHWELLEAYAARDGKQVATWIHDLVLYHLFLSLNGDGDKYHDRFN